MRRLSTSFVLFFALAPGFAPAAQEAARQNGSPPQPPSAARTSFDTPALEFDFPSVLVGVAEYEEGPTGATVFYFPKPVMAAVDVRGGAPGTINTDALRLGYDDAFVDAISFAGGSSYGLSVATGVADEIKVRTENAGDWGSIATVAGAIIFDLGGRRFNTVTPDYELGRAALRAARAGRFPLGARGAGRFATQGGYFNDRQHSGQGGAFRQIGATRIAVFTVVNALGSIVDRDGQVVRCRQKDAPPPACGTIAARLSRRVAELASAPKESARASTPDDARAVSGDEKGAGLSGNTTITLVVTNQKLPYWALQRLAVQVHSSLARAIQPFSTQRDGDTLFAVSTGEVENPKLPVPDLGVVAAEVAWDAVLNSMPQLDPPGARTPVRLETKTLDEFAGRYEFAPGAHVEVRREGERLTARAPDDGGLYFPKDTAVEIVAVSPTEFLIKTAREDRLRFGRDASGRVRGLTVNPGQWAIPARKLQ